MPSDSRRCLAIHPGSLGDVLLARHALAHLGHLGFRTTLAVTSRLVELFAGSGLVAEARDVDGLGLHRLFIEPPDVRGLEALAGYDAIVSWFGAGDVTFRGNLGWVGCPVVVARAVPAPGTGCHAARHALQTLAPLGPPPSTWPDPRLDVAVADRAAVGAWLGARGIGLGEAIVFQPGAGSAAKVWPGFAFLARRLRDASVPVVALAGPADAAAVEALVAGGTLDRDALARDWPLPRIGALFSLARAAVGNDSGPTHLAAAVGCPTVAVFGPTDPATWAPLGPRVRVVAGSSSDAPWTGFGVDQVEAALHGLLAGGGGGGLHPRAAAMAGPTWP
jgi:ADP-heptose:LPS heptosyltransferase